jgi:hypothetical protein
MCYDLRITRKTPWTGEDGPTISADEWLSLLDADPELSCASNPGDDSLAGAWKGETLFWFADGEVCCKNRDEPTVRKMVSMAERLGAMVQGNDGKVYRKDGSSFKPESPASVRRGGILMLLLCVLLLSLERNAFTFTITAIGFLGALACLFSMQVLQVTFYVMRAVIRMRGPRRPPNPG